MYYAIKSRYDTGIMINIMHRYLRDNSAPIHGKWIEVITQPSLAITKGFVLYDDGRAASINTGLVVYNAWRRNGDNLIFIGKSIGQGYAIDFTETMRIRELNVDNLVLARDGEVLVYMRLGQNSL